MKAKIYFSTLIVILCITAFQNLIFAQEIVYAYDASGNRIERSIVFPPRISKPEATNETKNDKIVYDSFTDASIKIFPNPTQGIIQIEISNSRSSATIDVSLYDLTGKQVFSQKEVSATATIDISELGKGNYLMRLQQGSQTREWKIVKL